MKLQVMDDVRKVLYAVFLDRVCRWAIDQYVMPWVERMPTKRKKPFGFGG